MFLISPSFYLSHFWAAASAAFVWFSSAPPPFALGNCPLYFGGGVVFFVFSTAEEYRLVLFIWSHCVISAGFWGLIKITPWEEVPQQHVRLLTCCCLVQKWKAIKISNSEIMTRSDSHIHDKDKYCCCQHYHLMCTTTVQLSGIPQIITAVGVRSNSL